MLLQGNSRDIISILVPGVKVLKYPARLSEDVEDWVNTHIPNRFEYVRSIFE